MLSHVGPLHGIKVVDLTRQLAGPQATRILADLGADVTCVEQTDSKGDMMASNYAVYTYVKHSKSRVSVDLRSVEGRRFLDSALQDADVFVENFRPGVVAAMGYSWASVHARFPRVIMCSISGFGQTGAASKKPAMDVVIQAMSGVMSMTGPVEITLATDDPSAVEIPLRKQPRIHQ